jgi:uncharacterized protein YjbI with pentapeptide repeats
MANPEHEAILRQGVEVWNQWRAQNPDVQIDLTDSFLIYADLAGVNFYGASLTDADLSYANLRDADLRNASFHKARLFGANLRGANLVYTSLMDADLRGAIIGMTDMRDPNAKPVNLRNTTLRNANFSGANLRNVDLSGQLGTVGINFTDAILTDANLSRSMFNPDLNNADLRGADLSSSNLRRSDLRGAKLDGANLNNTDISGSRVYGLSAWDAETENLAQLDLIITPADKPEVVVDNLGFAQLLSLLLKTKLSMTIDSLATNSVLIVGRFSKERQTVLDGIRDVLRQHSYVPMMFNFEGLDDRDYSQTLMTLAGLARFVIVDLSGFETYSGEWLSFAENRSSVPIKPIFSRSKEHPKLSPSFKELFGHLPQVLSVYRYKTHGDLIAELSEKVIRPAEKKIGKLTVKEPDMKAESLKQLFKINGNVGE